MSLQNGYATDKVANKELPPHENNVQNTKSVPVSDDKDENKASVNLDSRFRSEKKIFVGALKSETTEQNLTDYFSQFGEVYSCAVKISRETGVSRGFGFVVFKSEDSVKKVLATPEHLLNGKKIDPKPAKCSKDTQRKVFVGGLDPEISTKEIEEHFSRFGKVETVETPFDNVKMRRKSYAFVLFSSENEAKKAASVERQEICGKSCDVRVAVPRENTYRNRGPIPQQVLPADFQRVFLNLLYYGGGWNQQATIAAFQNQMAANSWQQQQAQQHQQVHSRNMFDSQQPSRQDKFNTTALVNRIGSLSLGGTTVAEGAPGSWGGQHDKQLQAQSNNGYAANPSSNSYFGYSQSTGQQQHQVLQQQAATAYPYAYSVGPEQAGGPQACYLAAAAQYADGQQTANANGVALNNSQQAVTQPANYQEFLNAAALMAANSVPFITAYPTHPTAAGDMVGFPYRQQSMPAYYQSPPPTDMYNTQITDPSMVAHRPLLYSNGMNGAAGPKQHYIEQPQQQPRTLPARLVTSGGGGSKPNYSNGYTPPRQQNGTFLRSQNGLPIPPPREASEPASALLAKPDGDSINNNTGEIAAKSANEDPVERQSEESLSADATPSPIMSAANGVAGVDHVKVGEI